MERRAEIIEMHATHVSRLVSAAVPGAVVQSFVLLPGGKANTNYEVRTDRGPMVLRLYARDGNARDKELALFGWLDDVPVPGVLGWGESEHAPYALLDRMPGLPLAVACQRFGDAEWTTAGRSVGRALAKIHARAFEASGDLQYDSANGVSGLAVRPWPFDGVMGYLRRCLADGPAARRLGKVRCETLARTVNRVRHETLGPVLTHGDFNATNLLVDERGRLTAVLDWEFAHAGDPLMDLGNLLRDDPDRNPPLPTSFVDALLCELKLPESWEDRARFIDLASALELLSSETDRPMTHARALRQVDAYVEAHAPPSTHVRFRAATFADLELLRRWDGQPHVMAADPHDDWGWEHELARDPEWRKQLIAEIDGRPVGFVQIIDPAREDSHYWGECPDGLRAIDIWIGEEADLGKGYGTRMMQLALERCFRDPTVRAVLVDPLQSNARARRFYERLGFRFVEHRRFGSDDCAVYRLDRDRFSGRVSR